MQLKTLLTLFAVCSLTLSCKDKEPNVMVCLIDSERYELQCSDGDGNEKILDVSEANNFGCLSPDDFQKLINYAKERCRL